MEPLEVFALDGDRNRMTGSIPYKTLTWSRKYYEPGQFTMQIPVDIYDQRWEYIYCSDRPETGMIQKVRLTDDSTVAEGVDTIELSGFFLEAMLNDLIFLVEETETETYYETWNTQATKPARSNVRAPELLEGEDGTLYRVCPQYYGTGTVYLYQDAETGEMYDERPAGATEVEVGLGDGMFAETIYPGYPGNEDGDEPITTGYYKAKNSYDYYTEDGQLVIEEVVDWNWGGEPIVESHTYDVVGIQDHGSVIYQDTDGSYRWINGGVNFSIAGGEESSYKRRLEDWENDVKYLTSQEGAEYDPETGTVTITKTRTVKGPWQMRTEIGEVGEPVNNVQTIINWAQRAFGNSILYDEPDVEGVDKVLEPSLKRIGDMFFEELQTIGASVRLFYSFKTNNTVFQIWQGVDRTQSQSDYPWAVFSDTWGTLYGYDFSEDVSNYRNKCYVLYDYDEPVWDASGNPSFKETKITNMELDESGTVVTSSETTYTYTLETNSNRGYVEVRLDDGQPDMETYLDLRNEVPEGIPDGWDSGTSYESDSEMTTAELIEALELKGLTKDKYDSFRSNMETRGRNYLETEYGIVQNLDTGSLSQDDYLEYWDLGDKVDMAIDVLGVKQEARIIGVEEVYEAGKAEIRLEIGDELLTDTSKLYIL